MDTFIITSGPAEIRGKRIVFFWMGKTRILFVIKEAREKREGCWKIAGWSKYRTREKTYAHIEYDVHKRSGWLSYESIPPHAH